MVQYINSKQTSTFTVNYPASLRTNFGAHHCTYGRLHGMGGFQIQKKNGFESLVRNSDFIFGYEIRVQNQRNVAAPANEGAGRLPRAERFPVHVNPLAPVSGETGTLQTSEARLWSRVQARVLKILLAVPGLPWTERFPVNVDPPATKTLKTHVCIERQSEERGRSFSTRFIERLSYCRVLRKCASARALQ